MYVLIGILLLGILVAAHEFGHFIAARLCGIDVMEFAVGMGPRVFGWAGKRGTKFSLRCIPLGGFCAFYGEDDAEGKTKDDPRAYHKQKVWRRLITVASGPMMNFVLAFVVAVGFYAAVGLPAASNTIAEVSADRPAAVAGLLPGDAIIGVNGVAMGDDIAAIQNALNVQGNPVDVTVRRGSEEITLTMTPAWDEEYQRYMIGITFGTEQVRLPIGLSVAAGWDYCVRAGSAVFEALGGLFTSEEIRDSVSGPVGAVAVVADAVKSDGFEAFISLLVMISVNLGIMNLLPIPGLDGSRIVFHAVEAVRGKPVKPEKEAMVHLIGMVFLLGLMIFFTFKDVIRIFG